MSPWQCLWKDFNNFFDNISFNEEMSKTDLKYNIKGFLIKQIINRGTKIYFKEPYICWDIIEINDVAYMLIGPPHNC